MVDKINAGVLNAGVVDSVSPKDQCRKLDRIGGLDRCKGRGQVEGVTCRSEDRAVRYHMLRILWP